MSTALLLVGGAIASYFAFKQPDGPQQQAPQRPPLDANIDPQTLDITWGMYERCPNPWQLRDAAAKLRQANFPYAASLLEARAAQIAPQQFQGAQRPGFAPPAQAQGQQVAPQAQPAAPATAAAQPTGSIAASVPADVQEVQRLQAAVERLTPEQRVLFNAIPSPPPAQQVRVAPQAQPRPQEESILAEVIEPSQPLKRNSSPNPGITVKEKGETKSL